MSKYTKEKVIKENEQHKKDIIEAVEIYKALLTYQANHHDDDKNIPEKANILAHALNTGDFKQWNEIHCKNKMHHFQCFFNSSETTLLDLVECACDCVAASMRRSGKKKTYKEEYEYFIRQGFDDFMAMVMANTFIKIQDILNIPVEEELV